MILKLLEVTEDLGMWWVVSLITGICNHYHNVFGMYRCTYVCISRCGVSLITRVLSA